jgi:hypothetical protein
MAAMQTVSARISSEDLVWLASLEVAGATTPSDKIRALIGQLRRQHEGSSDFASGLAWMRELVAPVMARVGALEHHQGNHSEIVRLLGEWVPQCMAVFLAQANLPADGRKPAVQLEEQLATRAFQLLSGVLRLGLTPTTDCYDPRVLDRHLPHVLELAAIIAAQRSPASTKETKHG